MECDLLYNEVTVLSLRIKKKGGLRSKMNIKK